MNKFLRSFFESNLSEFPWTVQIKSAAEKLWGYTPPIGQGAVFVHDFDGLVTNLLYGLEFHLLILYATLFGYIDFVTNDSIVAAVIVWCVDLVVRETRKRFGESNIAKKSLLDSKFLI